MKLIAEVSRDWTLPRKQEDQLRWTQSKVVRVRPVVVPRKRDWEMIATIAVWGATWLGAAIAWVCLIKSQ